MIEMNELKDLIRFLRGQGVVSYTSPQLSLVLGAEPMQEELQGIDKPEVSKQARRGADGLTAKEQELLYDRALDGE